MKTIEPNTTALRPTREREPEPAPVSLDLRVRLGDRLLEAVTWRAVRQVTAQVPPLWPRSGIEPAPARLLALLAFCYATGLYASEDIEYALQKGRLPRDLTPRAPVSAADLQAFRRANRPWVELTLALLLASLSEVDCAAPRPKPRRTGGQGPDPDPGQMRAARRAVALATLLDSALGE